MLPALTSLLIFSGIWHHLPQILYLLLVSHTDSLTGFCLGIFPQSFLAYPFTSFRSVLKCHFINSAFPYHCSLTSNLKCIPPSLSFLPPLPLFFSSLALVAPWHLSSFSPSLPQKYKHIIRVGIFFCVCSIVSIVSNSATVWTVAHQTPRPWDFPGKNTGVGCHVLLQEIFSIQGWNWCLLHLLHCRRTLYHWATWVVFAAIILVPRTVLYA